MSSAKEYLLKEVEREYGDLSGTKILHLSREFHSKLRPRSSVLQTSFIGSFLIHDYFKNKDIPKHNGAGSRIRGLLQTIINAYELDVDNPAKSLQTTSHNDWEDGELKPRLQLTKHDEILPTLTEIFTAFCDEDKSVRKDVLHDLAKYLPYPVYEELLYLNEHDVEFWTSLCMWLKDTFNSDHIFLILQSFIACLLTRLPTTFEEYREDSCEDILSLLITVIVESKVDSKEFDTAYSLLKVYPKYRQKLAEEYRWICTNTSTTVHVVIKDKYICEPPKFGTNHSTLNLSAIFAIFPLYSKSYKTFCQIHAKKGLGLLKFNPNIKAPAFSKWRDLISIFEKRGSMDIYDMEAEVNWAVTGIENLLEGGETYVRKDAATMAFRLAEHKGHLTLDGVSKLIIAETEIDSDRNKKLHEHLPKHQKDAHLGMKDKIDRALYFLIYECSPWETILGYLFHCISRGIGMLVQHHFSLCESGGIKDQARYLEKKKLIREMKHNTINQSGWRAVIPYLMLKDMSPSHAEIVQAELGTVFQDVTEWDLEAIFQRYKDAPWSGYDDDHKFIIQVWDDLVVPYKHILVEFGKTKMNLEQYVRGSIKTGLAEKLDRYLEEEINKKT